MINHYQPRKQEGEGFLTNKVHFNFWLMFTAKRNRAYYVKINGKDTKLKMLFFFNGEAA